MTHHAHNRLVSFIWSIADDCLRDVYVRGKYRDVILPMTVLRRLDSLLEPTKQAVFDEIEQWKKNFGDTEILSQDLEHVTGYVFYNTSKWTLSKLKDSASNTQQYLLDNFIEYLNGFSANVQEIIKCFNLYNQITHMSHKGVLLSILEKFVSPYINLTPDEKADPDGNPLPALTNLGMGYVFEELIRKFNEENNEEAGEHFTPREVIELMTHIVFDPIADNIPPVFSVYDPACGSGGMLTESQNFIEEKYPYTDGERTIYLFGKEINDETYAICKSDMMIKGNSPENIKVGSTLASDEFSGEYFDFMLSNPPYGKSWASDESYIKDGKTIIDNRFKVRLTDYWGNINECDATPRTSDGQLLFLMEMVSKMKPISRNGFGSRIASVHNGSSLFTGDAGGGESNIRRYLIENDLLEAIIQLPNNIFYNTGITTYIWLLSNNKAKHRKGKVQLIDANELYTKLRKNLGEKNCELTKEHIARIVKTLLDCENLPRQNGLASQVFNNQDFGYYKVAINRPDRRKVQITEDAIAPLRFDKGLILPMQFLYQQLGEQAYSENLADYADTLKQWADEAGYALNNKVLTKILSQDTWQKAKEKFQAACILHRHFGEQIFMDYNIFIKSADRVLKDKQIKLTAADKKAIYNAISVYDETAEKVIEKTQTFQAAELTKLLTRLKTTVEHLSDFGYYPTGKQNEYITYATNSDLNDSENIPLTQNIHEYFLTEVKPHIGEAWIDGDSVKIGYEISFNKYFYQHKALRCLKEIQADILALEKEADGLIGEILENI
ncbi:MAG: SAM-dependent DNA methyltransferase [Neisseriaceae bacterium]|nr:SAM-dependent DNA methyltransferase [Neisseriaceae bacterium]